MDILEINQVKEHSEMDDQIEIYFIEEICYFQNILCLEPVKLFHLGVKNLILSFDDRERISKQNILWYTFLKVKNTI